jgi:hypothetical protein
MRIALERGSPFKEIVSTLLTVQRFLIDKKDEKNSISSRPDRINQMFSGFYQTGPNRITSLFFEQLSNMAKQVFSFDEIENAEELDEPTVALCSDIQFRFDKSLLRMICFEILVNAKKNRWLFLNDEMQGNDGVIYRMNKIWIEGELSDKCLLIRISNTGPAVKNLIAINRKKNIKRYDTSSGIELIDTLLTEFNLGEMFFEQKDIELELSKFTVILKLNENGSNTEKYIGN